ncbi:MAG: diguanylate cyclase [Lachnospiraceae bacterium]|nr:diguanylate cyclase [Lachnospiraceae bacterium]
MTNGIKIEDCISMINNVIAGICVFEYENKKLKPIFANDGFFRMLGYPKTKGEKYLKNVKMHIIPEDMPIFEQGIEDVLKDDGSVEIEFRTVTDNGSLRWLQVTGNLYSREGSKYVIVTVIHDITEKKNVEEELLLQAEQMHIIMEASDEKIMDYNAKTDVLVFKLSSEHSAVGEIIINRYLQQLDTSEIYSEDVDKCKEVFDSMLKAPKHDTVEIRTKRFDGSYKWYQFNLTSLLGAEGYVTRIVGRVVNIHEKKLQEIDLELRAKRDSLNNIYSEDTARQLIDIALSEKENSDTLNALMIVDIDNCKHVSDVLGQAQVDKILAETAMYLSETAKGEDIVGKLDIDKFVLYIRNLNTLSDADLIASEIVKKVRFELPYENEILKVNCSVGVAISPYHGINYEDLYNKTQRALSRTKANGKCGYRIYDAASTMAYHALRKSENVPYDPEKGMALGHSTEDMVMQIFLEEKVFDAALKSAIELITVRYKFHRGYICGNEKGSLPNSKLVQFSVRGYEVGAESDEQDNLRRIIYEIFYESYKGASVIHEYDISVDEMRYYFQSQGIKSLLYYPLTAKGEYQGAIVFENHEDVQLEFEDSVMEELRSLFRILEAHLLQVGLMDRLQEFVTQMDMMDNMDSYAYIVNTDTYEISFVNKKLLMSLPNVKIGDICYKAMQERDTPCEHCVFRHLNKKDRHARHTEEMFVYSLRCWNKISASWLECKEKNALVMLNGVDISEYFMG